MAKKYDWDSIKSDYEIGKSNAFIHKKYDIPYNTLSMKIKRDNWEVVNKEKSTVEGFKRSCEQISEVVVNNANNPSKIKAIAEDIDLSLEEMELMTNNRKIAKFIQSVIVKNKHEINLKNIKTVSSTLKDIESIANPKPEPISINNTTQTITGVQLIDS